MKLLSLIDIKTSYILSTPTHTQNAQEKWRVMNETDLPLQLLVKNKLSKKVTFGSLSFFLQSSFVVYDSAITRHCTETESYYSTRKFVIITANPI